MIYNSKRKFKLWAYTVSHKSLLVRSYLQFPDEEEYSIENNHNIDLEFMFVEFLDIPSNFDSLSITIITQENLPLDVKNKLGHYRGYIFELSVNGNYAKHYIVAGSLLIGTNQWVNKDRIFNLNLGLNHDNILFSIN